MERKMNTAKILVTGGYGCIGAETTKWLLRNTDAEVIVCSRTVDAERGERVFHRADRSRIEFVRADVTQRRELAAILADNEVTDVIHLAAFQSPDCNRFRDLGLQINLAGTQNLIEEMKERGCRLRRFIFASSIAVYGPRASYPQQRVPMTASPQPVNVYGAWKLAGESVARFFSEDTGISTISLRPGVLFGPGRDAGLTSTPTTAMKCIALGIPYEIPFRSRSGLSVRTRRRCGLRQRGGRTVRRLWHVYAARRNGRFGNDGRRHAGRSWGTRNRRSV